MTTNELIFRLKNVRSHRGGNGYVGFVLNLIDDYLNWKADFYLPSSHGRLDELKGMRMVKWDPVRKENEEIRLIRSSEDDSLYLICGFPEERFDDFSGNVQRLWNNYYRRMNREMGFVRNRFFKTEN